MKKNILLSFFLLFFTLKSCVISPTPVSEEETSSAETITIKGCEVIVVKSYQLITGNGVAGYMGMVKKDCDCVFDD